MAATSSTHASNFLWFVMLFSFQDVVPQQMSLSSVPVAGGGDNPPK
jgi:hypothetical protein